MRRGLQHFCLVCLLAIGTVAPGSATAQVVSGDGKGTTYAHVPGVSTEVPLLSAFQVTYAYGDNHVKKIEVWPNRVPPDASHFDTVRFTLADKHPWRPRKDRFHYYASLFMGPLFGANVQEIGPVSYTVPGSTPLPPPPSPASVFALVGFSLTFECIDDHHISRVAVREVDGNLEVALQGGTGRRGCEAYTVKVLYTWIHPLDLYNWGTVSGATPQLPRSFVPLRGGQLIVRGFDFRVSEPGKDQHLAQLGVVSWPWGTGAFLEPNFMDKHGPDSLPYNWTIDWAEVGHRYLRPPDPRPLSPDLLRDSGAAKENATEWMKRHEPRITE